MHGTGVPLVTPFDGEGEVDEGRLRDLAGWVEERGVDFVVPCGSTGSSELMSAEERARVVEIVAEAASVPVLAGAGHPGYRESRRQVALADEAGADAALVVTPFYYPHDQETMAEYYRDLADAAALPIYLYSVPPFAHAHLEPETVGELADHEGVRGLKDSSGDVVRLQRELARVGGGFETYTGSGSVYAHALDSGADGGILALGNLLPRRVCEIERRHAAGDHAEAYRINADLVELNRAVVDEYGIPGLKAAMRLRGAPAGHVRRPHRPVDAGIERELESLLAAADP